MFSNVKLNAVIYVGSTILSKALPFLLLPLIANYLTTEEYGAVSNFSVFFMVLEGFILFSGGTYLSVNYYTSTEEEKLQIRSNIVIISFIIALVFQVYVFLFQNSMQKFIPLSSTCVIVAPVVAFFYVVFRLYLDELRLSNKAIQYGISEFLYSIINLGFTLFFIINLNLKSEGRVGAILITNVVVGSFSMIYFLYTHKVAIKALRTEIKSIIKFSLPLVPHNISNWVRSGLDRYVITLFLGLGATGVYGASFQLASVVGLIIASLNKAIAPYIFKVLSEFDKQNIGAKKEIVKQLYAYLIIIVIGILVYNLVIRYLIRDYLPEAYQESINYVAVLSLGFAFQAGYFVFSNFILFKKKSKKITQITLISMVIQMPILFVLTNKYGVVGSCVSFVVGNFINMVLAFVLSRRVYPMPWL